MPSTQTQQIRKKLASINLALNVLDANRLTVTNVSLEGVAPRIDIVEGSACRQFQRATSVWRNHNGHRETEHVAIISGCQVRWIER